MTAPTRRQRGETTHRVPALVVVGAAVAAAVGAGLTVDGRTGDAPAAAAVGPADLATVAPAPDALGSTWYCAAGTGDDDGTATHRVSIANVGSEPVDVVLTVVPGTALGETTDAEPVVEELTIDARSREVLPLGALLEAPFVAAVVEAGRGEVVVEHSVGGGGDDELDLAPCASTSSPTWYVAASRTTRDARAQLALFNPFPDDAVVDISFVTPEGQRAPEGFSGFIVPAQRVAVVDFGVNFRYDNVSVSIVARSGRLVVERLQSFDGSDGPAGLAVTPAAPEPSPVWHLPDGLAAEGITEIVTVYNPTDEPAEVDVEVALDPTSDVSQPAVAEPFSQTVAPHGFAQIDVGADGRVPLGRGHSITVRSQNGVPVVAERWIRSEAPAARSGFAATLGSPVVATRWLAAAGGAGADVSEYLVLLNPAADGIARVSVAAATPSQLLPIAGLDDVEVPAQGRVAIDLGQYLNRPELVLVIDASTPVVAERGLYPVAGGLTASILVPSGPTAAIAEIDPAAVGG